MYVCVRLHVCVPTAVHCDDGSVVLCEAAEAWRTLLRRRTIHLRLLDWGDS